MRRSHNTGLIFLSIATGFCLLLLSAGAWACSKHGTGAGNDIIVEYRGAADEEGYLLFVIGIEDEIVEPTETTTCVTGIGMGSPDNPLPTGVLVSSAHVDVVNRSSGKSIPLEDFRFAPNDLTSRQMAAGGGSAAGDPRPLFDGSEWYGFSSSVQAFTVNTGPDEFIRMTFEVLVPEALVPFITGVQFASGEGQPDGTPIFTGAHPVQYYTADDPLADLKKFEINSGLNDAWYNPETDGQGFLISVFPDAQILFLAWFTYDVERPADGVTALLGEPGHRWLTAQGPFMEDRAELDITLSSGGRFDSELPPVAQMPDGSMTVEFTSCNSGLVNYDIPSVNRKGVIPIERIVLDNALLCEALGDTPPAVSFQ